MVSHALSEHVSGVLLRSIVFLNVLPLSVLLAKILHSFQFSCPKKRHKHVHEEKPLFSSELPTLSCASWVTIWDFSDWVPVPFIATIGPNVFPASVLVLTYVV
jgi:hypothetical protein